jgi:hypothetical protein
MADLARELGHHQDTAHRRGAVHAPELSVSGGIDPQKYPEVDLRLTTNGTLLPGKAKHLKELGVKNRQCLLGQPAP